jgi:tetraacyldisaccharide 4'-kinase
MKAPRFWNKEVSIFTFPLLILSWGYRLLHFLRQKFTSPLKAPIPVICVGNISLGGTGKTPTALSLYEILFSKYPNIHYVSRGYKGTLKQTTRVSIEHHTASDVGDEPLLLARQAPTWIGPHRSVSALAAIKDGADLIILDDGLQNPTLFKDLNILVIDGKIGLGNGHVFPLGPLREKLQDAIQRVQAIGIIGEVNLSLKNTLRTLKNCPPCFEAQVIPSAPPTLLNQPLIAFAGLAYPEKFFATLKSLKAPLISCHSFSDHHLYTAREFDSLYKEAQQKGAKLITTEKDWIRLTPSQQNLVLTLPIRLKWDPMFAQFITCYLKNVR